MIPDFFPENALGDGPKNSRIRVKGMFTYSVSQQQSKSHLVEMSHVQ